MKPFVVLIVCFGLGWFFQYLFNTFVDVKWSGRIDVTVMLLFTAAGHFKFKKGMAMMLPGFFPAKSFIIMATGLIEIVLAVAIQTPALQTVSGWLLIVMFILFLPANIYAASRHLNYETGAYNGQSLSYLWFRIPFRLLLIGCTYFSVIQHA